MKEQTPAYVPEPDSAEHKLENETPSNEEPVDERTIDRDRVYEAAVEAARTKKYQELEQERKDYPDLPFFLNSYYKKLLTEFREKQKKGEVPKQRLQHLQMLARMWMLGYKRPRQTLKGILNHLNIHFFHEVGPVHSSDFGAGNEIKRVKYETIKEVVDRDYSRLNHPETAIRRLEELGVSAIFYPVLMEDILNEVYEKIGIITEMDEKVFRDLAGQFQAYWWLSETTVAEISQSDPDSRKRVLSKEFLARINFLLSNGELSESVQNALQIQENLILLDYFPASAGMADATTNPERYEMIELIAKELNYIGGDEEFISMDVRKLLEVLWDSPPHLEMAYNLLQQGWRFKADSTRWVTAGEQRFLGNVYMDEHREKLREAIEFVSGITADPAKNTIWKQLGIETIEDALVIEKIIAAIKLTRDSAAAMPVKRRASCIDDLWIFDRPFIRDVAFPDEENILNAWKSVPWHAEQLKILASEALAVEEDGSLSQEVVLKLLEDTTHYFKWLKPELIASLSQEDALLLRLVQSLESKNASALQRFLITSRSDISRLTDEQGNITADFVRAWFSNETVWSIEDLLAVEPLLEKANLAPGFIDHIRLIASIQSLERFALKEHLWPIFNIFLGSNQGEEHKKLLRYWLQNSPSQVVLVELLTKADLKELFGEEIGERFLSALPKETEERRNAFLHNDYDRTSRWLRHMLETTAALSDEPFQYPGWPIALSTAMSFNLETDLEMAADFISSFGLSFSEKILMVYKQLWLYERKAIASLPDDVMKLGLESTEDLQRQMDQLHELVVAREPFLDTEKLSGFQVMLLGTVSGRDSHRFLGGPNIEVIVDDFSRNYTAGEIEATPAGYESATVSLREVEIAYEPSEAALAQYETLSGAVLAAMHEQNNPKYFQKLADGFRAFLEEKKGKLEQLMETLEESKRKGLLIQQQQTERSLQALNSVSSSGELLVFLSSYKTDKQQQKIWEHAVAALVMHRILITSGGSAIQDMVKLAGGELDSQRILIARNVIGELVKHHVLDFSGQDAQTYWDEETVAYLNGEEGKRGLKTLKKLFGTMEGVFREEVSTFQKKQKEGSQSIEFIPDRGIVGELSGYIANACYSKEYPLLKHRKVVPYKFVEENGGKREVVGSVLLFEVETSEGQQVLLVRAFNIPEEGKYDTAELFERFLDYCQGTAAALGKQLVLIPGLTGAVSNYSMVISHVTQNYIADKTPVTLKEPFTFNGYDLTRNCYVARKIPD